MKRTAALQRTTLAIALTLAVNTAYAVDTDDSYTYAKVRTGTVRYTPTGVWGAQNSQLNNDQSLGYFAIERTTAEASSAAFGWRYPTWHVELDVHKFGKAVNYSSYPYDENQSPCTPWPACNPIQISYAEGWSKGIGLTAGRDWTLGHIGRAPVEACLTGGVSYDESTFQYYIANEQPGQRDLSAQTKSVSRRFTGTYGACARLGGFVVEYTRYHDLKADVGENHDTGNYVGAGVLWAGYEIGF